MSSVFHYNFIKENTSEVSSIEGNVEFLKSKRSFHNFEPTGIPDMKKKLVENNIECRL